MKGIVNKIIPFSNVDGPGNRLSIFFQGCNFDCLYCHNPETIEVFGEKNIPEEISVMTADDILREIAEVEPFISGITVSGGECSLQWKFLTELFTKVKKKWKRLTCFVDSNGSVPLWTEDKKEFVEILDKVMIDIKAYDKIYEVRTVIVPEIIDNEKTVDNISKLIAHYNKDIKYKLIKYRQNGVRRDVLVSYTPDDDYMNKLKKIALKNGLSDVVIV